VFDPAIWKEDSIYYAVTGGRTNTGPGHKAMRSTSLFSSKDLKNWKYEHDFMKNERFLPPGEDASCPYFWPIGNRHIFLFFSHTTGSQYLLGDYNKEEHCFYPTFHGRFNFMSFLPGGVHAPSATSDGKGGVIVIHNMHTGKKTPGWRGITTLPRRLTLDKCDTINIQPYGDYESLRTHHQHIDKLNLPANEEIIIDNIKGNALEIKAEININSSPMIEMNVLRSPDKEEFTSIKFFKDRGVDLVRTNPAMKNQRWSLISLETAHSSILPDVISRAPELAPVYLKPDETLKLHIFIDKSIVEVFVNDKQVVTARVYPGKKESTGISLKSQGTDATLISMNVWQMKSTYKELQNDFIK
jgi:glycosyl hydrolase family 32 domain protein